MTIIPPSLPEIGRFNGDLGSLGVVDFEGKIPFKVQRVYWLSDVPESGQRGIHAHKTLEQIFITLMGGFSIMLDVGTSKSVLRMDMKSLPIYVGPGTWRSLFNFEPNTVVLVLASAPYSLDDYIFDYDEFRLWVRDHELIQ